MSDKLSRELNNHRINHQALVRSKKPTVGQTRRNDKFTYNQITGKKIDSQKRMPSQKDRPLQFNSIQKDYHIQQTGLSNKCTQEQKNAPARNEPCAILFTQKEQELLMKIMNQQAIIKEQDKHIQQKRAKKILQLQRKLTDAQILTSYITLKGSNSIGQEKNMSEQGRKALELYQKMFSQWREDSSKHSHQNNSLEKQKQKIALLKQTIDEMKTPNTLQDRRQQYLEFELKKVDSLLSKLQSQLPISRFSQQQYYESKDLSPSKNKRLQRKPIFNHNDFDSHGNSVKARVSQQRRQIVDAVIYKYKQLKKSKDEISDECHNTKRECENLRRQLNQMLVKQESESKHQLHTLQYENFNLQHNTDEVLQQNYGEVRKIKDQLSKCKEKIDSQRQKNQLLYKQTSSLKDKSQKLKQQLVQKSQKLGKLAQQLAGLQSLCNEQKRLVGQKQAELGLLQTKLTTEKDKNGKNERQFKECQVKLEQVQLENSRLSNRVSALQSLLLERDRAIKKQKDRLNSIVEDHQKESKKLKSDKQSKEHELIALQREKQQIQVENQAKIAQQVSRSDRYRHQCEEQLRSNNQAEKTLQLKVESLKKVEKQLESAHIVIKNLQQELKQTLKQREEDQKRTQQTQLQIQQSIVEDLTSTRAKLQEGIDIKCSSQAQVLNLKHERRLSSMKISTKMTKISQEVELIRSAISEIRKTTHSLNKVPQQFIGGLSQHIQSLSAINDSQNPCLVQQEAQTVDILRIEQKYSVQQIINSEQTDNTDRLNSKISEQAQLLQDKIQETEQLRLNFETANNKLEEALKTKQEHEKMLDDANKNIKELKDLQIRLNARSEENLEENRRISDQLQSKVAAFEQRISQKDTSLLKQGLEIQAIKDQLKQVTQMRQVLDKKCQKNSQKMMETSKSLELWKEKYEKVQGQLRGVTTDRYDLERRVKEAGKSLDKYIKEMEQQTEVRARQHQRQVDILESQYQEAVQQRKDQQRLNKELSINFNDASEQIEAIKLQNILLSQELQSTQQKLKYIETQMAHKDSKKDEIIEEQVNIESRFSHEIDFLKQQNQGLLMQNKETIEANNRLKQSVKSYEEQIQKLNQEKSKQQAISQKLNSSLQSAKEGYLNEVAVLKQKIMTLNNELEVKDLDILNKDQLVETAGQVQAELTKCQSQLRDLQQQLTYQQNKIRDMQNPEYHVNSLFQHLLLEDYFEQKLFIKRSIEDLLGLRVEKTRLLYAYDALNKVNFHKYIDYHPNILLIVQLNNGCKLAAFSQESFQPKKISKKQGLIMSVTRQQAFPLLQGNKRAISYDDYYVIFGNSEVRIKALDTKIFSNFAISNAFYNARGFKVDDLLGGNPNEREIGIASYEFYQLELGP